MNPNTDQQSKRPIAPQIVVPGFSDSLIVKAVRQPVEGSRPVVMIRLQTAVDPLELDMTLPLESFRKLEGFIKSVDEWSRK